MMILERYQWPGNVRELMNVLERAVSLTEFNQITPLDLPRSILESVKGAVPCNEESFRAAKRRVEEFESRYLSDVLSETGGNVSEAARRCGMQRSAFQRLMPSTTCKPWNSAVSRTPRQWHTAHPPASLAHFSPVAFHRNVPTFLLSAAPGR
jgi:DNA-binding NtrC family response regulator